MNKLTCVASAVIGAMGLVGSASQGAVLQNGALFATVDNVRYSESVTGLPYFTPVTASDANATSIITPDFTSTTLKVSFSQTATGSANPISGEALLDFTADAGDTYSVFGSTAPVGGTSSLEIQLYDSTTQQYIYHYTNGNTLFGTNSGSLPGGDLIEFLLADDLELTPSKIVTNAVANLGSNTGSGGITILQGISVPEPVTSGLLMTLAGIALPCVRRRRRN